jgi:hypothetical protein
LRLLFVIRRSLLLFFVLGVMGLTQPIEYVSGYSQHQGGNEKADFIAVENSRQNGNDACPDEHQAGNLQPVHVNFLSTGNVQGLNMI